jgi:hypothetical protein
MFTISKHPPLSLPDEAIGRASVILAQRGGGKTYLAMMLAESMLEQGKQLAILDPTGVWYGLTSSADGKSAGIPILVMGGAHGDVPLEPTAGAIVARFIVETGSSVILDLSAMQSNAAQDRFATDFAETLYRLKSAHRSPLLLVADEADSFAPQKPQRGQERMLGAFDQIARRGRAYGLGIMFISQRPAVLNKNCLSQADVLLCGRVTGRRDFDALKSWTDLYGDAPEFSESLPRLKTGEFWVWSPAWLNVFKLVKVCQRRTYDSSASPTEAGAGRITRAPVDLKKLSAQIAETVETAAANDPAKLRARIAALEKELANRPAPEPVRVEVPTLTAEDKETMGRFMEAVKSAASLFSMAKVIGTFEKVRAAMTVQAPDPRKMIDGDWITGPTLPKYKAVLDARPNPKCPGGALYGGKLPPRTVPEGKLSKCERAIMTVLAQNKGGCTKRKIALCSRYSATSSSFLNALSSLRTKGFIQSAGDHTRPLPAGLDALGDFEPMPEGEAAINYWIGALPKCEGEILNVLKRKGNLTKEEIAAATASGYSVTSSSFLNALSALRTRELITRGPVINLIYP